MLPGIRGNEATSNNSKSGAISVNNSANVNYVRGEEVGIVVIVLLGMQIMWPLSIYSINNILIDSTTKTSFHIDWSEFEIYSLRKMLNIFFLQIC